MDPPLTQNRLLALLPLQEQKKPHYHFQSIHFARKRIMCEAGQSLDTTYFFQRGMASLFVVAEDSQTVHVAIIGTDGFVGPALFSGTKSIVRIVTQTSIDAVKIDSEQLFNQNKQRSRLRELLLQYSQVLQVQITQSALCNSLHNIKQRLCRWLLVYADAIQSDEFELTQEDLADMLGSHRNQISARARELSRLGLIRYTRGDIKLLDKTRLEQTACECYRVVHQWKRELLNL